MFIGARYTNYTYDFVLDVYFAHFRFYDAANRTFMAEDPAMDGLNLYQYVRSNPVTYLDILGLAVYGNESYNSIMIEYYFNHDRQGIKPGEMISSSLEVPLDYISSGILNGGIYADSFLVDLNVYKNLQETHNYAVNAMTKRLESLTDGQYKLLSDMSAGSREFWLESLSVYNGRSRLGWYFYPYERCPGSTRVGDTLGPSRPNNRSHAGIDLFPTNRTDTVDLLGRSEKYFEHNVPVYAVTSGKVTRKKLLYDGTRTDGTYWEVYIEVKMWMAQRFDILKSIVTMLLMKWEII